LRGAPVCPLGAYPGAYLSTWKRPLAGLFESWRAHSTDVAENRACPRGLRRTVEGTEAEIPPVTSGEGSTITAGADALAFSPLVHELG
jgi:hypothetical protein